MLRKILEFFYFHDNNSVRPLDDGSYFEQSPADLATELRRRTVLSLAEMGIPVKHSHHEVAPSQHEIDLQYTDALTMADSLMTARLVVKEIANNSLHSIVATSILVLLGLLAAYVATFFVDTNILTLILSFSPGGIYEVAVIAIAFDLDPDFVAFHHIIRLLFILFLVPIIMIINNYCITHCYLLWEYNDHRNFN